MALLGLNNMSNFIYESDKKKGKKNKLKVGQKVRARSSLVDWYSSHLVWSYSRAPKNSDGYTDGEKEIDVSDLPKIYAWARARLMNKMPVGVVTHYGAHDNDDKIDRKNVGVVFTFKTEMGNITYNTYVQEKDLETVVKRGKK